MLNFDFNHFEQIFYHRQLLSSNFTALCAELEPIKDFESVAPRRFQNLLCTTLSFNRPHLLKLFGKILRQRSHLCYISLTSKMLV